MTKKAPRCPLLLVYMHATGRVIVIVVSDAHAHATRTSIEGYHKPVQGYGRHKINYIIKHERNLMRTCITITVTV